MHRKLRIFALAAALAAATGAVAAQDFTVGWSPRTGDVWIDTWAGDMNRYGSRYRDPFIDEMVRYHGAPRPLVVELLEQRRWAPGDVYLACSIASIIGRPCRYVVDEFDRDRGQGWGVIAKRMGIKPGSAEFHRLKRGFVPTYDRWGRPITLDVELERAYPGRGKGGNKSSGHGKSAARVDDSDRGSGKAQRSGGKPDHAGSSGKSGKGKASSDKGGQGKGKKGGGKGNGKG